jgi:hypothetical protein
MNDRWEKKALTTNDNAQNTYLVVYEVMSYLERAVSPA